MGVVGVLVLVMDRREIRGLALRDRLAPVADESGMLLARQLAGQRHDERIANSSVYPVFGGPFFEPSSGLVPVQGHAPGQDDAGRAFPACRSPPRRGPPGPVSRSG